MRIKITLLTALLLAFSSTGFAQSRTPTFTQYAVKVENTKNVRVNLKSHKNANNFRTNLRNAAKEGVSDKASFVRGDMFEADISQATVLALFLLPDNMMKLQSKFLDLKPGSRIVGNTFGFQDWTPDAQETISTDCSSWCTALLWIVPAKVEGTWQSPQGELTLQQNHQMLTGTLTAGGRSGPIAGGRLRGDQISFTVAGAEYSGRVNGDIIEGTVKAENRNATWKATRAPR